MKKTLSIIALAFSVAGCGRPYTTASPPPPEPEPTVTALPAGPGKYDVCSNGPTCIPGRTYYRLLADVGADACVITFDDGATTMFGSGALVGSLLYVHPAHKTIDIGTTCPKIDTP